MTIGLGDLVKAGQDMVRAVISLQQTLKGTFPQQTGTSATATGGAATLPPNPVGFVTITLPNGTAAKIPYYGA